MTSRPPQEHRRWTMLRGCRVKGVTRDGFPDRTTAAWTGPGPGRPATRHQPGGEAVSGSDPRSFGWTADTDPGGAGDGGVAATILSARSPGRGRLGAGMRTSTQGSASRVDRGDDAGEGERAVEARSGSAADAGAVGPAIGRIEPVSAVGEEPAEAETDDKSAGGRGAAASGGRPG